MRCPISLLPLKGPEIASPCRPHSELGVLCTCLKERWAAEVRVLDSHSVQPGEDYKGKGAPPNLQGILGQQVRLLGRRRFRVLGPSLPALVLSAVPRRAERPLRSCYYIIANKWAGISITLVLNTQSIRLPSSGNSEHRREAIMRCCQLLLMRKHQSRFPEPSRPGGPSCAAGH